MNKNTLPNTCPVCGHVFATANGLAGHIAEGGYPWQAYH
jgi:rubredoxin